jgi:imidazolonepropionase-like amidohydrolase
MNYSKTIIHDVLITANVKAEGANMKEYVIKCGTLIDGTGKKAVKNARILVKGERIARVKNGTGSDLDAFLPSIDASTMTVIPGVIDSHKHIFNDGGSGIGVGLTVKQIYRNIHTIIQDGVTSVLDLGAPFFLPQTVKFTSLKPRIFWSGPILTCKGGYPIEYMKKGYYMLDAVRECDSEKSIKKTIRGLYKKRVDVIKTAVVSKTFRGGPQVKWTDRMLQILTDEAHGWGFKVCAHITYPEDYGQAARCGIDSIHHASYDSMHDKDMNDMIEKGIIFVPTMSLIDLMLRGLRERWIENPDYKPPVNKTILKNMREFTKAFHEGPDDKPIGDLFIAAPKAEFIKIPENMVRNVKRYIQQGGMVAMGTDSALGFSLHTFPYREMEMLHECGLSIEKTIHSSTLVSAMVFNRQYDLGSIEAGKLADFLIVSGELDKDISCLKKRVMVIKDGAVIVDNRTNRTSDVSSI